MREPNPAGESDGMTSSVDTGPAVVGKPEPRTLAGRLVPPLGCVVCALACTAALVLALSAVAESSNESGPAAAPYSVATATVDAVQSMHACSRHPWCVELRDAARITYDEIAGLTPAPLLVNALDYRYFEACHASMSVNLWGALLWCELLRAEAAHPVATESEAATATGLARADLAALEVATRGRPLNAPLARVLQALAAGTTVVFYCGNPS